MKPSAESVKHRRVHRAVDFAFCCLAALAIITSLLGFQAIWGPSAFLRWGSFLAFSALLFWVLASNSPRRPLPAFLYFFVSFLAAHTLAWLIVLWSAPEWRLVWFAAMGLEVPLYTAIYNLIFADQLGGTRGDGL